MCQFETTGRPIKITIIGFSHLHRVHSSPGCFSSALWTPMAVFVPGPGAVGLETRWPDFHAQGVS
jgi:hypothetical protein